MSTETMTIEPPTVAAETTYPHLVFEIDSAGAANTIYVTSDASVNDITLKIATTATATFTPATTVVPESQASTATGSLLYLDLTPLQLTSAEFEAISPKTSGWQIVMFPAGQLIGMTPDADTTLEVNDTIDISIGALAPAQATGASVSLTVNVFRVGGITIGNLPFPTNFSVALATPPVGGQDLSQDLTVDLATPDVVNSIPGYDPVNNQLAFAFFAGPRGRAVTPGPASQFNLSFVYATDPSGYGALCTPDQVKPPFEVITGVNASAWKITPNRSEQSPSWTLRPPTTGPIVREGPLGTVGILANNLITNFQPGPTLALISYSGFDGYADGVFTLPIEKHGHVAINSLTVTPNPTVLDNGAAEVTVSWKVQNAGTMTLAPFDVDVTDKPSYQGTITDTTQITLTAEGTYLSSAGNIAIRNTTAVVLPVIDSFDATPRAAYAGDLPREIDLSWNVNTNEQLQLKSSAEPPDPNRYNAVGTVSKVISEPQMFTLVPLGQSGGPTVERSIVVSAFTPQTSSWPLTASFVAAPPNASFVLASDGKANVVAVDTMVYKPVSGPVPVGAAPAGMAFSADGSRLYVANSGDGTVSVLTVAATASAPQYEFTSVGSVTVGGSPRELALSPDSKYLYVTVDGGSGAGRLVVLSAAGQPTVISTLNVGTAPRGLTVMPSGAQIFVANSGSSTVTVIGRAPDGHHSVVDTLTGVSTARDVAVSPDGNTLLVVCPTAGAVIAINAVHPQAPRNTITVGSSPQQVALVPGGAYAVITNQGDGTVSLLTVGSTPSACRQLAGGIAVGSNPDAVAVTPDAGLVLVGCSGPDALAVVTLAEYQTAQAPPAIGGQPTGVRVAPDGKTAVGWHDANQYFSIGKPSTGLFVYDVASETVTPQLATTPVIDFIYDPTTDASAAFLVQHGQQNVSLVATDTWSVTSTIDLSADTTGTPVALASSGDGTIVFVLTADTSAHCKLLVLDGSTGSYSVSDAVAVLTSSVGSGLTLTTLAQTVQ
jgi:DNA-binding beta-propeller fold protein YncE